MSYTVLECNGLSKRFSGQHAVQDLSFEIKNGQVLGLLGPNGSGKTTTLGMLLGVLQPTTGSFSWFGLGRSAKLRQRVGSLLERPRFYPWMSANENLKLTATIRRASFDDIPSILKQVGLGSVGKKPVGQFSLGLKQRLGIAACLLGDPEVLVLDEPTNGMDPQGIVEIRELIIQQKQKGKTIILASHILDEVEKVCTDVLMLNKGRVVSSGSMEQTLSADGSWFELKAKPMNVLEGVLQSHPQIGEIKKVEDHLQVSFRTPVSGSEVNQYCFDHQLCLHWLVEKRSSLEENFLEKLKASEKEVQS